MLLTMGPDGLAYAGAIPVYSKEGIACISDTSGTLLFYASSNTVYNALGDTMLNGEETVATSNTLVQGALILPVPESDGRYYLFQLGYEDPARASLHVSEIDMSLDGGKGAVISSRKGKRIAFIVGESLAAVKHGNGVDWWVVVRSMKPDSIGRSDGFYLIRTTADGFSEPEHIVVGATNRGKGEISFSSDGSRLAVVLASNLIQIFDFNRCQGTFLESYKYYNDNNTGITGCAWAPESNSRLFVVNNNSGRIWDIALNLDGTIEANEVVVLGHGPNFFSWQLELADDKSIYSNHARPGIVSSEDSISRYLSAIRFSGPDLSIATFDTFAVYLGGNINQSQALPNFANYDLGVLEGSPCDTSSTAIPDRSVDSEHWSVYPNPAMDQFCLVGERAAQQLTVVLYSAQGREVWQAQDATSSFGNTHCYTLTETLPSGSYLLWLLSEDGADGIRLQLQQSSR